MIYELPFNHGKVYRVYDKKADCIFYDLDCGWRMKKIFTFKMVETAENDEMLLIVCGPWADMVYLS